MSEQPHARTADSATAASKEPRRAVLAWLCGVGFLILAAGICYVWQYPNLPAQTPEDIAAHQLIDQRLGDVGSRLTRLEQRPPPDLGKIITRVDALESRAADQSQVSSRIDTVAGRIESLSARSQTVQDAAKQQRDALAGRIDGLTSRIDALASRIAVVEANAANVDTVAKRLNRVARLQEASFALASGQPVGDVPGAPEGLTRYAHEAPPTEAQIRQRFQSAQQAALAAKPPQEEGEAPFIDRVWDRAQDLVTVRRGDNVVVGNTSAAALGRAQAALDAGDLPAAVTAIESLKGSPAQAMAGCLADAKSLLSARSALAGMVNKV